MKNGPRTLRPTRITLNVASKTMNVLMLRKILIETLKSGSSGNQRESPTKDFPYRTGKQKRRHTNMPRFIPTLCFHHYTHRALRQIRVISIAQVNLSRSHILGGGRVKPSLSEQRPRYRLERVRRSLGPRVGHSLERFFGHVVGAPREGSHVARRFSPLFCRGNGLLKA